MKLYKILVESFEMLKDEPRFFVPRLVSTSISTLWFVLFFERYMAGLLAQQLSNAEIAFYFVSGPLIVFLGVFVSVMLARMVDKGPELKNAFTYTIGALGRLFKVTSVLMVAGFLVSLPMTAGIVFYPLIGLTGFLMASVASILLLILTAFAIYFLPIAIVESKDLRSSLVNSVRASRKNSWEVSAMLILSIILLALAGIAQGTIQTLGYIGFALSRLISAVTTTYLFIVSPNMYLGSKSQV